MSITLMQLCLLVYISFLIYTNCMARGLTIISSLLFISVLLEGACEPLPIDINPGFEENLIWTAERDSIFISSVKKRARQMAYIEWIPKAPVPHFSSYFVTDVIKKGIPYSSVKELDKFVGFDVSFYTFMTAVNNPRSVLYTENVGAPPYKGINCSTYYGTVCSAAVCYALGINFPWGTNMVGRIPHFAENPDHDPFAIDEGDLLLKQGHAAMVYEIERDAVTDTIKFVSIFEAIGSGVRIKRYNSQNYLSRWNSDKLIDYKYVLKSQSAEYQSIPFYSNEDEPNASFGYNNDICPQLGDKAVYKKGDEIIINVLNNKYQSLNIYKDSSFHSSVAIQEKDVKLQGLDYGRYTVYAIDSDGGTYCNPVCFDVVDMDVSVHKEGDHIRVNFASNNARPIFITICNENGGKWNTIELSEGEILNGQTEMELPTNLSRYYCKVYFETEWGRVTNIPIKL